MGIFTSRRKRRQTPTQFALQDEKCGKSMNGFSFGSSSFVRLVERDGTLWRGGAIEESDGETHYRFSNSAGEVLTGCARDGAILLRDSKGKSYKGVVD